MDPLGQLYPNRTARHIGQVLGDLVTGNVGTPGLREEVQGQMFKNELALQQARKTRGEAIMALGRAQNFDQMQANRGQYAGELGLGDALYTAALASDPDKLVDSLLQGQEYGNRQGILGAPDWETANRYAMAVEGKPLQLATVQGQNLIANQYAPGGGGVTTTEQGRASILKDQRQVFDAGQNGVHVLDIGTGSASPVSVLGGGSIQPQQPVLGDSDPFASLHAAIPGLRVTSQRRTPERNAEVGGVPNSYHLTGEAIDIGTPTPEQQAQLTQWAQANGYRIKNDYKDGHWHLEPNRRSGGQLVNAGGGKQQAAPSGYRFTANGNLEAIPGGPADPAVLGAKPLSPAQRMKLEQSKAKEQGMLSSMDASLGETIGLIDGMLSQEGSFGGLTGAGAIGSRIPGTRWADLAAKLQTLRARSAFGSLQEMRANSPTGGALGQVSERELDLLMNAETQLSTAQSPQAFGDALRNYKRVLEGSRRRMREGFDGFYDASGLDGGILGDTPPAAGVDDLLSKYGAN